MSLNRFAVVLLTLALAFGVALSPGCAATPEDTGPTAPEVRIIVPAEGPTIIGDDTVEIADLRSHLQAKLEAGTVWPDSKVYVIGDADTDWERLREAYGKVLATGLRDVKIASRAPADSQQPQAP